MKTVVMIPTYNEKDNILPLIDRINNMGIDNLEILVVDDNSPDGTWCIVEEKIKNTPNLRLLNRGRRRGRGFAGIDGFRRALAMGADFVIEMDGDFSHDPSYIPDFLEAAKDSDLVIGSRFVPGGSNRRQSAARNLVTKFARLYLRAILGFRMKDPTSGYRCFRKETLRKIELETLKSACPFIVTETLHRCLRNNLKVVEIPITFNDRAAGESKLGSGRLYIKYLFKALKLRLHVF